MLKNEYFKNKFRINSARLANWDYGDDGYYFVTICTKDAVCYFGDVADYEMILNRAGYIAKNYWRQIPKHFKHVKSDAFIVMPNHIHGILIIKNKPITRNSAIGFMGDIKNQVETHNCASLQRVNDRPSNIQPRYCGGVPLCKNKFGPQSKNLAAVVRAFKSSVKRFANQNQINFCWQARYYDRIIRDEIALFEIRHYIQDNPRKWQDDRNFKKND